MLQYFKHGSHSNRLASKVILCFHPDVCKVTFELFIIVSVMIFNATGQLKQNKNTC